MTALEEVKALTFDVFGTVVDWRTSIAEEGAAHGITANTVAPGPIKTGLTASSSAAQIERLTQGVPVGRYGTPDEIAAMVAFLVSDEAAFVTGAVIDVNGGSVMR